MSLTARLRHASLLAQGDCDYGLYEEAATEIERLKTVEEAAWLVDRQPTLHTDMCSQQGSRFVCQCARAHLAAALGPVPEAKV
jgi:hypothetical protein